MSCRALASWLPLTFSLLVAVAARESSTGKDGKFAVGVFIEPPTKQLYELENQAWSVSNPQSSEYGRYYQQHELVEAIGLSEEPANAAAEWLKRALKAAGAPESTHEVTIVAHRDAAYTSTRSFEASYELGRRLNGTKVGQSDLSPPAEVELVVTPPMPEKWCLDHTRKDADGEVVCPVPCVRKAKTSKGNTTTFHCKGDSGGWQCWPDWSEVSGAPRWRCFDMVNSSNSSLGRRPRRTGRVWRRARSDDGEDVEAADASSALLLVGKMNLRVSVSPLSSAMEISIFEPEGSRLFDEHSSMDLSFQQSGQYRETLTLQSWTSCHLSRKNHTVCRKTIPSLANLRPVSDIALCYNTNRQALGTCICNTTSGQDANGRPCVRVYSRWPHKAPADSVLPAAPQGVSNTLADLGIDGTISSGRWDDNRVQQAVGEFNLQTFSLDDLKTLHSAFGFDVGRLSVKTYGPSKGEITGGTSMEGALDMQFMTTVARQASTAWIGIHPNFIDGFMLAYTMRLNDEVSPPLVHSISWGASETDFVPAFIKRLDYELMKLALRGVTMLTSSGDNGISSEEAKCNFTPGILTHSPWVTVVGATMPSLASRPYCSNPTYRSEFGSLYTNCEEPGPIVCSTVEGSLITSSGGWSTSRSMPPYQAAAVESYLASTSDVPAFDSRGIEGPVNASNLTVKCATSGEHCPIAQLLRRMRATSDVSAPGFNFAVVLNGSFLRVDGTSASSPIVGALVALLNAEQRQRGEPPMGFWNPWLYQVHASDPGAFLDVTVGNNSATETTRCRYGFVAGPGWDPPTGLGVPQFARLVQHLPTTRKPGLAEAWEAEVAKGHSSEAWEAKVTKSRSSGDHRSEGFLQVRLAEVLAASFAVLLASLICFVLRDRWIAMEEPEPLRSRERLESRIPDHYRQLPAI